MISKDGTPVLHTEERPGPRFGVVIPAFNAGKTVQAAIASALGAGAIEVIVVDDGSTDRTAELALAAGARVITVPNNGAAAARALGIAASSSSFVSLLDADDQLEASGTAAALLQLQSNTSAAAVCGRTIGVHAGGATTHIKGWNVPVTTETLLRRGYGPCPPSSIIWTLSSLRLAMGDQPPALWPRSAEDYELLIRVSLVGEIMQVVDFVSRYDLTGGKSARNSLRSVEAAERIREHYAEVARIRIRTRGGRARRSLSLVRDASSLPRLSVAWISATLRAFVVHPPTVMQFVRDSFHQR